ncbi:DUF1513 domain-containing protein [Photobacterium gaetbulicola]|uniref:DUF1513 domain-containing protein n=1 Tax=Photobacterium gaetbulicola TaxID=1295392 RepID=UPI0012E05718|nr:DUF1513 domain-containing protein [Photobacterium gaetbulicola]
MPLTFPSSKGDRGLCAVYRSILVDASGVGVRDGKWLVGSGAGKVLSINPPKSVLSVQSPVMWDNHWNIV